MKNVSVKSTKQELIDAYAELSQSISTPASTGKAEKTSMPSAITKAITSLKDLIPELEKEQTLQLKETETAKAKLESFYRDLTRTEEELRYQLKKDKVTQTDALETELKEARAKFDVEYSKKLTELESRETKLTESERELKELRDDAKVAPARVAMELKKAVETARAEEIDHAAHAKALANQTHSGDLALRDQKISMLEKLVADQAKEISSLKASYDHAAEQMKAMAVSAINTSRPLLAQPTLPPKE